MNDAAITNQQTQAVTLKSMLKDPLYQKRFQEILGARSAQFVSSVLSVGGSLGTDCEPTSIIASAMTAATLDLPVDKNLGFAWIVPYKTGGKKLAQFQMGYKGYIQLGLRTGQYERMNARVINEEAFQGWDEVGEPIIDWSLIDEAKPTVGYVFAFKLVNGFTKIAYWPKTRVEAHAKRYSKSYGGNYSSPWTTDFDPMALKTVIKNELAKWGILSIEMVNAIKHDQTTKQSLDGEPEYLDGSDVNGNGGATSGVEGVKNRIQRTAESSDETAIETQAKVEDAEAAEPVADTPNSDTSDAQVATAAAPPSKAESQKTDQINWILDFEKESDENAERVAKALEDRNLQDLTPGQVKDIFNELQK